MHYKTCEICGIKSGRKSNKKRVFLAQFPLDEKRTRFDVTSVATPIAIQKNHRVKKKYDMEIYIQYNLRHIHCRSRGSPGITPSLAGRSSLCGGRAHRHRSRYTSTGQSPALSKHCPYSAMIMNAFAHRTVQKRVSIDQLTTSEDSA